MAAGFSQALAWTLTSVLVYLAMLGLYRWRKANPFLIPVATGAVVLMLAMKLTGKPYPDYARATEWLRALIGPATVALAVPMYVQLGRLKSVWRALSAALVMGCAVAIASAMALAWLLGAGPAQIASLAPKSATMPIAMPVAEQFGGQAAIAALAVAITGVAGAIFTDPVMRWLKIDDPRVRGFAAGLTAHAIGLAREIRTGPIAAGFAALAMCLNAVATAVLVPLVYGFLGLIGR